MKAGAATSEDKCNHQIRSRFVYYILYSGFRHIHYAENPLHWHVVGTEIDTVIGIALIHESRSRHSFPLDKSDGKFCSVLVTCTIQLQAEERGWKLSYHSCC